jgi:hypothetical protein
MKKFKVYLTESNRYFVVVQATNAAAAVHLIGNEDGYYDTPDLLKNIVSFSSIITDVEEINQFAEVTNSWELKPKEED